jgi:hypothetical protein
VIKSFTEKIIFSKEEQEILFRIMNNTWQEIGYDLIQCNEGKDLPRSHVIETVVDADRLSMSAKSATEKDIVQRFYRLPYKEMEKLGKKAFPFSKYGM